MASQKKLIASLPDAVTLANGLVLHRLSVSEVPRAVAVTYISEQRYGPQQMAQITIPTWARWCRNIERLVTKRVRAGARLVGTDGA